MNDEEWLKAAVADDSLVVQLLLRLSHSWPPPASLLDWTIRQPRSKSITLKSATARASPTTPLSWSAATSNSGGAIDGFEESSRAPLGSKQKPLLRASRFRRTPLIEKDQDTLRLKGTFGNAVVHDCLRRFVWTGSRIEYFVTVF